MRGARTEAVAALLSERLRERTGPQVGDQAFVHLLDLRDALRRHLADAQGTWLDYGSGVAPYRSLMPRARLATADLPGAEAYAVDYELLPDGRCTCPSGEFEGVLSTQVLEHVDDPVAYLREAYRVLRPNGRLVLTTHGVWEDHGDVDLWRWTADGLRRQVHEAGFEVESVERLTCDARAVLLLLRRAFAADQFPARGPVGVLLALTRWLDRRAAALDRYSQRWLRATGMRRSEAGVYIALLVSARRPASSQGEPRGAPAATNTPRRLLG